MRLLLTALLAASLASCASLRNAPPPPISSPRAVYDACEVTQDEYTGVRRVESPILKTGRWTNYVMLRSSSIGSGDPSIQVYVAWSRRGDWIFFDRARDRDRNEMDFVAIDRSLDVGWVVEQFGLNVSREYLEERAETGLDIRAYGQRGVETFRLPPQYVQGFLARLDGQPPAVDA